MTLPIKFKGVGAKSLHDARHAECVGGAIQGAPYVLDTQTEDGMIKKGRIDSDNTMNWLGSDSFQGNENINPWDTLRSNGIKIDMFKGVELS